MIPAAFRRVPNPITVVTEVVYELKFKEQVRKIGCCNLTLDAASYALWFGA
jgi:alpha-galactosidase/6-phospho-beta-glucosidase family protein